MFTLLGVLPYLSEANRIFTNLKESGCFIFLPSMFGSLIKHEKYGLCRLTYDKKNKTYYLSTNDFQEEISESLVAELIIKNVKEFYEQQANSLAMFDRQQNGDFN